MATAQRHREPSESRLKKFGETVRRALVEFLWLPLLIIAAFVLLAVGTSVLDFAEIDALEPLRARIREHLFRNGEATSDLLATIAGSVITVTSITFSLLLLAVQQAAAALTAQVYDQFLRRRVNHVYFGSFVGLAVFTLVILATVNPPFNPVIGATVALLLTIVALTLLISLLYTTINQMRPVVVIETIHDRVLLARKCERDLLSRTRRRAQLGETAPTPVYSAAHGYLVRVDLDRIAAAVRKAQGAVEIVMCRSVGCFVAFQDVLAKIHAVAPQDAAEIAQAVQQAIVLEQQRDLDTDPGYGIDQLAIIGWTSVSTAKSNPAPGILVLHSLRDLLARWCFEQSEQSNGKAEAGKEPVPVVYTDDVFAKMIDAFETLAVVASESMQPQTMAEVFRTFAVMFERLPGDQQARVEDLIRRSLSALGEHVLTAELNDALSDLIRALDAAGQRAAAAEVEVAQQALAASIGKLGSRATRVSAGK